MNVLCIQPGKRGKELIELMDCVHTGSWTIVGNPDNEETRRMFVKSSFWDTFTTADVPISMIRLISYEDAAAYKLSTDKSTRSGILDFVRNSDTHKYSYPLTTELSTQ